MNFFLRVILVVFGKCCCTTQCRRCRRRWQARCNEHVHRSLVDDEHRRRAHCRRCRLRVESRSVLCVRQGGRFERDALGARATHRLLVHSARRIARQRSQFPHSRGDCRQDATRHHWQQWARHCCHSATAAATASDSNAASSSSTRIVIVGE